MNQTLRPATKNADNFISQSLPPPGMKRNIWEIALTVVFPGIGQIIWGRCGIGISLIVLNGLTLYILWFILMPISLGMLLHDRRE